MFANGVGSFTQTGGTVNVLSDRTEKQDWDFALGFTANSTGVYDLSGGSLEVEYDSVIGLASTTVSVLDVSGSGVFKTGYGTAGEEARDLVIGSSADGSGLLNLTSGKVDVAGNIVTGSGWSRINYDGGTLVVGNGTIESTWLVLGNEATGDAALVVDGATNLSKIDATVLYVGRLGTGTLTQTAGEVTAGFLSVGADKGSTADYSGGILDVTGGLAGEGVVDLSGVVGTFNSTSMLLDLEGLSILDRGGITWNADADSLVIFASEAQKTGFGEFNAAGVTHIAGSGSIIFGSGQGFTGWGTVDDPITMQAGAGTIQENSDPEAWLYLHGKTTIVDGLVDVSEMYGISQSGGTVTTDLLIIDHVLAPGSTPSDISGGQLNAGTMKVGVTSTGGGGTGIFTQTGGELNVTGLTTFVVGEEAGSTGTYDLDHGDLTQSGSAIVGDAGNGLFRQIGGTHTLSGSGLLIGDDAGGEGEYHVSGTTTMLTGTGAGDILVGNAGQGLLTVGGGSVSIADQLWVAELTGSVGTVLVTGGVLDTAAGLVVGASGSGYMEYTGGEVNVGGNLLVGYGSGGYGELLVKDRTLDVTGFMYVGDAAGSVGTVTQTDAVVNVDSTFILGNATGSSGSYVLNSGLLITGDDAAVGYNGVGVFTQIAGIVTVGTLDTHRLVVGSGGNGVGSYTLTGADSLLQIAGELSVGFSGTGVFIQNNGTVLADHLEVGASGGSDGSYLIKDGLLKTTNNAGSGDLDEGINQIGDSNAGNAWFRQEGGVVDFATALTVGENNGGAGPCFYEMAGGSLLIGEHLELGNGGGKGTFDMTGGDVVVGTNVLMGSAANALGVLLQSGGTMRVGGGMMIGNGGTSTGTVNVSGTTTLLDIEGLVLLGDDNDGLFNQTGGTVDMAGELRVANVAGSTGEYNLSDGKLTVDTITLVNNGASGVFNWTGGGLSAGTLNVNPGGLFDGSDAGASDLTLVDLHVGTTGSVVDMGSHAITVAGDGTLAGGNGTIRASDITFNGTFTQLGGVVQLAASSITVGTGATYNLGSAAGTGDILEDASGANLTINTGGMLIGWTDSTTDGVKMTGTINNSGKVIADGFDQAKTLDLTNFTTVDQAVTNTSSGTNGWYAQNQGTLALPAVAVPTITTGVGTTNWGSPELANVPDLVNSLQMTFTAVDSGFDAEISLLSNDDPVVIADPNLGWDAIGVQFIGVWLIEDQDSDADYFDQTNLPTDEKDDQDQWGDGVASDTLWSLKIRYDHKLLDDLLGVGGDLEGYTEDDLRVYYYDGTDWVMLNEDINTELDKDEHLIWIPVGAGREEGMYAIVIPEPGTMAMLALGGVGMLLRRRKRKAA